MSEENTAIVRRFYDEVMGKGDFDALNQLVAPDFVDHGESMMGSPQGREALRQSIVAMHSSFPDFNVTIDDTIADGEMVGIRGTMKCTHQGKFMNVAPTGNELTWKGLAMFRVVDGKIVARWFNSDSLNILQQVGLAPVNF